MLLVGIILYATFIVTVLSLCKVACEADKSREEVNRDRCREKL